MQVRQGTGGTQGRAEVGKSRTAGVGLWVGWAKDVSAPAAAKEEELCPWLQEPTVQSTTTQPIDSWCCRHLEASPNQRIPCSSPPPPQQQLFVVAHSQEADPSVAITTRIYTAGICCPSEVPIIHNVLRQLPGVHHVDVAVVTRTVTVEHAAALTCPATLVAALNDAQLGASLTFPRGHVQASGLRGMPGDCAGDLGFIQSGARSCLSALCFAA